MANTKGVKAVSILFRSAIEVAIRNSLGVK
jgi:hypothetical protein